MILKPISINLNDVLNADDKYLPLSAADQAKLDALVPDGESILLTISDDVYKEFIQADRSGGTFVLTRGIDSDARKFPKGSCVFFEDSVPVIKWLICNYECCSDDCEVAAVKGEGMILPEGKVNNAWTGTAVFSGELPVQFGVTGLPDWCKAEQAGNYVKLAGTPTASGSYNISVAASNDSGKNLAIQQGTIVIKA